MREHPRNAGLLGARSKELSTYPSRPSMPQQAQAPRYHDLGTVVAFGLVGLENTESPSGLKSKAATPPFGESCNLVVEGWLGLFDNCSLDRLANASYPSRIRGSQLTGEALSLEVWPKSGRKGLYSWQSMMGESGHAGRAI